ncbi:MAG: histidine phosphatase family protein [Alphaproteobacteria bacterium]|nr:histidine phosphatase family protein [Alphaproteobacteria bacterium]
MSGEMIRFPDWVYRQSAVLPYRQGPDGLEVLLITSRKGRRWVLPKGIIEPGLTAPQSAAKEAREEAGVAGSVGPQSLGRYWYKKWGGTCGVEVFPMEVREEAAVWPEATLRRRQWLPMEEAAARIDKKALRRIIRRLPETVSAEPLIRAAMHEPAVVDEGTTPRLIYLLRHAKAVAGRPARKDFDRPLSAAGRQAADKMAEYMRLADVEPDLVLCSPALRTRETLAAVQHAFAEDAPIKFDRPLYMLGARGLLNRLKRTPDRVGSVLVVAHNPGVQALALALTGSGDSRAQARMSAKFPPGALAILVGPGGAWAELAHAGCELHSFVSPGNL